MAPPCTSSNHGSALRISIDSTDSLAEVIRIVEAAYNVTLTVTTTNEASTTAPAAMPPKRGGGSRAATAKGARATSNRRGRPDQQVANVSNEVLRSWARENGHTVSDRGRIPKAVVEAHRDAPSN
jgi:hypothetical protein